jgi:uncharacterized protein with HEPN domain
MARSLVPRLNDILRNIDFVHGVVAGKSAKDVENDMMLRLAIERAIEIVSEAVRHIPMDEQLAYPEVPWRNIRSIGNKLRHEYDRLDADIIWEVAAKYLLELRPVIVAIKAKQPPQASGQRHDGSETP